ncbi:glycosyltransferase [Actinomycetospora chiangmaiensis]|uniref:glycosyltransferase n=1 Tax=Actinomycetospora chiangmaiensis TaxID=402650 RepID=UPI000371D230|nr:glycosyltransferase [Actinomycetospora chiangmaiensis]
MVPRELAVLIVSYRRADLLDRALASVDKWLPEARVHVWDNGSAGSPAVKALAATRPDVTWTFSEFNLGYIAAMNKLMAQVPDCDVLQLNPDAELLGPCTRAREVLAEPGVAVVSPTVLDPEGRDLPWDVAHREQGVVRNLLNSAGYAKRLRGRTVSDLYPEAPEQVDGYLTGCALFISRDAWNALGPFDEQFFVYGEDATWQPNARRHGWQLRLVDEAEPQVRHSSGGTVADDPLASMRGGDLLRSAQVMVLGLEHNAGRGSLYAAGSTLLDRVQRSKRGPRRARLDALAAQAGGRPAVVVITNGLRPGGAERQRVVLANELVERGHPVTLVCLQHLGQYISELDPRVRMFMQPWWQPVVDVAATDEAIVVGGCTKTEIGFATAWRALGRVTGQQRYWIPAAHDPAELDRPTYSEAQARALRTADGLLVLSRQHHADLSRHQRLTDRVMVAPNGLTPGTPLGEVPTTGPVRFCMLTRLKTYKNTTLLIRALDALGRDDWTLDIFGEGPDRDVMEAETPAHLTDRVHWRGVSPGPDHAFAETDVLCVPSGFEAFPLVMVEAMTRGMPVMASASGSVPEMLDGGAAGVVVEPVTVEAWSRALAGVLDDRAELARLGRAGRERALALYTDDAMVDAYQRAFVTVLGHGFPGSEQPAATV